MQATAQSQQIADIDDIDEGDDHFNHGHQDQQDNKADTQQTFNVELVSEQEVKDAYKQAGVTEKRPSYIPLVGSGDIIDQLNIESETKEMMHDFVDIYRKVALAMDEGNITVNDEQAQQIYSSILGANTANASGIESAAINAANPAMAMVNTILETMAVKWGLTAARKLVSKALPRAIPGVGPALLVKDIYDFAADYDTLSNVLNADKSKAEDKSGAQDKTTLKSPTPGLEPDNDSSDDEGDNKDISDAANRAEFEKYQDKLRAEMQKPVVKDKKLNDIIEDLYKEGADTGSGSSAAALREEIRTGKPIKDRYHNQKVPDNINRLEKWLRANRTNEQVARSDIHAAENVLRDCQNAFKDLLQKGLIRK